MMWFIWIISKAKKNFQFKISFLSNRNESDFLTKLSHLISLSTYPQFVLQYSVVYFHQLRVDFVQTLAQHILAETKKTNMHHKL